MGVIRGIGKNTPNRALQGFKIHFYIIVGKFILIACLIMVFSVMMVMFMIMILMISSSKLSG